MFVLSFILCRNYRHLSCSWRKNLFVTEDLRNTSSAQTCLKQKKNFDPNLNKQAKRKI